ncbi:MAG TPA: DMT family transporter [Alphaproteobacteria bacterium]|nr:DMT family transporter [Alphaproteobacteria bacterium]
MSAGAPNAQIGQSVAIGAGLLIAGLACFAGMEAVAKYLIGRGHTPVLVAWARYIVNLALLALLLVRFRPVEFVRTRRLGLQVIRSLLILTLTVLFFAAVKTMTLADTTTILYAGPLLIVVMSGPVLGERVGLHRWTGVIVGFIGVVIIVRPGGDFGWGAAMAFGAAFCYAGYALATRILGPTESPVTTVFYTALVGTVPLSVAVPFFWSTPVGGDWFWLAVPGALGAVGHYFIFLAYRSAPASALAPFAYTHLIWAALYGLLIFAERPDEWTFLGAAIITGAGIYVWYREQRRARAAAG